MSWSIWAIMGLTLAAEPVVVAVGGAVACEDMKYFAIRTAVQ